jgi:hypothetical protein
MQMLQKQLISILFTPAFDLQRSAKWGACAYAKSVPVCGGTGYGEGLDNIDNNPMDSEREPYKYRRPSYNSWT